MLASSLSINVKRDLYMPRYAQTNNAVLWRFVISIIKGNVDTMKKYKGMCVFIHIDVAFFVLVQSLFLFITVSSFINQFWGIYKLILQIDIWL